MSAGALDIIVYMAGESVASRPPRPPPGGAGCALPFSLRWLDDVGGRAGAVLPRLLPCSLKNDVGACVGGGSITVLNLPPIAFNPVH